jgi:serine/threonine protein kinase
MAEVWLATDIILDRKVALKWLKPSLATDPVVAERFRREAIAVAGLTHPNIVAVHDVFEDQGRQAVVMQLVDGKSLRQLLDVQTRLSPELTIHIGTCVASALDAAHNAGFVHRDVKPGNILITADGRVLLTDFGIAKGLDSSGDDLTSDNVMMGTAKYLSPEQVRGRRLDGRADLYSLGLVLYECLAGRVPFLGETDADTALARLQRDPTDLGRLRPTIPRGLVNLVHRLLSRNPAHRPATGAELRAELLRVAEEQPPDLTPLGTPPSATTTGPSPVGPFVRVPRSTGQHARQTGQQPRQSGQQARQTGQHARQTGQHARTRPGAPPIPGEATPPSPVRRHPRDATPAAGPSLRGQPARGLQSRTAPSMVLVVALLAVALAVSLLLWITIGQGDGGDDPSSSVPGGGPAATNPAVGPATITGVRAFDPDGDGEENDDQASAALLDGNPDTNWRTLCYQRTLMNKPGVGLVVSLSHATVGELSFTVANPPFQVEVFGSDAETPPSTFEGWGQPLQNKTTSEVARPIQVTTPVPARHLLIALREIGRDPGCSADNPYRGSIGEITFG